MSFDPIERARKVEDIVMQNDKRKYYRFRYTRYYGGIVTADTVGCNLLCAYCWNYFKNLRPEKYGEFYSPEEVAEKLRKIARAKNCYLFRISGAEPILGERSAKHVAKVISLVDGEFILETNGLMLGYNSDIVNLLVGLNVVVRVTIKGWDEDSFEKITGAKGEYFRYQLKAVENLAKKGVPFWVAIMYDVFGEEGVKALKEKLPVPLQN
ncbi:radical SAM protein [Archaeoglobus profundus]|uniref:Radical SAM domain protein n=1 Tax=Archaeoglobus profundus (strain DSM 5631 / JCM 9629 / NBRC 100127 / Av18) TaxID=572546 RepID=D2RH45_ARCPA|nr:radical SAM protein [Archaeoglobus profundus]ADB57620.1 Radical SAM domain protein [Archaeoglobus profundus DSM 5631]